MKRGLVKVLMLGGATLASLAGPVAAQRPALAMLDQLEPGSWELRVRGEGGAPERICLESGRKLIQIRHPATRCSRVIVEDTDSEVTVQYTCPGNGYGRTNIRRESSRLVQLDSQGIVNGVPFSFAAEARKVGNCRR